MFGQRMGIVYNNDEANKFYQEVNSIKKNSNNKHYRLKRE
jgi:hypothetical protein